MPDRGDERGRFLHTDYKGLAVSELRSCDREVDAKVLSHIFPACNSAVNYCPSITVVTYSLAWPFSDVTLTESGWQRRGPR